MMNADARNSAVFMDLMGFLLPKEADWSLRDPGFGDVPSLVVHLDGVQLSGQPHKVLRYLHKQGLLQI